MFKYVHCILTWLGLNAAHHYFIIQRPTLKFSFLLCYSCYILKLQANLVLRLWHHTRQPVWRRGGWGGSCCSWMSHAETPVNYACQPNFQREWNLCVRVWQYYHIFSYTAFMCVGRLNRLEKKKKIAARKHIYFQKICFPALYPAVEKCFYKKCLHSVFMHYLFII